MFVSVADVSMILFYLNDFTRPGLYYYNVSDFYIFGFLATVQVLIIHFSTCICVRTKSLYRTRVSRAFVKNIK